MLGGPDVELGLGGEELSRWLEDRLREQRESMERQHLLLLAQLKSFTPKRTHGVWMGTGHGS